MTDQTKWYVFWLIIFLLWSMVIYAVGFHSGTDTETCRKVVLDDLGKSLEYQLSIKQMVGEQQ